MTHGGFRVAFCFIIATGLLCICTFDRKTDPFIAFVWYTVAYFELDQHLKTYVSTRSQPWYIRSRTEAIVKVLVFTALTAVAAGVLK